VDPAHSRLLDLNEGYGTFRDRDRREIYPAPIDAIFGALETSGEIDAVLPEMDVITWRGNLSKLLTCAWNVNEAWTMEAELVNRCVVLNVRETEDSLRRALTRDDREERMCYWGYAFEESVCAEKPFEEPVDCLDCFCSVVRTKLGTLNVLMCGEVDCFDSDDGDLASYVELKTTRVMNDPRQVKKFEKEKLLKWWAQSYALGVRRILVGFRDDVGKVVKLQMLETLKLPGYVAAHEGAWNARDGLRCASLVLTRLKEILAGQPAGTRVRVEYEPRKIKFRINFIKDDSIPDFLPADARERLMRGGKNGAAGTAGASTEAAESLSAPRIAPSGVANSTPVGSNIEAPEISETASAMSIRARSQGSNRMDYIRSLGPAAILYMQGKDPSRSASMRAFVNDATDGGIGIDPSTFLTARTHTATNAVALQPTSSAVSVRGTKRSADDAADEIETTKT
jgi:RAT1-interacting protein